MADIETEGGAVITGHIETQGGKMAIRDDVSHNQSISFQSSDNAIIWSKLMELVVALDNLPQRVGKLEVVVEPASMLEKLIYLLIVAVAILTGMVIYFLMR